MDLRRFDEPAAFYRRAEPFLLAREAEHTLILGICATLMQHPERVEAPPYLALVEAGGGLVAAAVMTPPHQLVLSMTDVPDAPRLFAEDLHQLYPALPGVLGPKAASRAFAEAWRQVSGQPYRLRTAERIYQLERVTPVTGAPGELHRATAADRDLVVAWLAAFYREALGDTDTRQAERTADFRLDSRTGGFYLWVDGRPVSLTGYGGPTPNGIRIAPVYTPPELRGRGYASACVAATSQRLLDEGRRYCFLYTDLSNPTSNHIYQAIGYRPVCDVDAYAFEPAPGTATA